MKNYKFQCPKTLGAAIFSLYLGASLCSAADINITSDADWFSSGTIGGSTYTSADKIHIKTASPNAVPTVTFDIGAGNSTTVDAIVLGWLDTFPSVAGNLTMDSGKIFTGGIVVGIPFAADGSVAADARPSTLAMNSGTEIVITGKDDGGGDYNGFFIAKSQGTPNASFRSLADVTMTNAKLTFASALDRTSLLSVGNGENSTATFTVNGGSVIRQDTSVSGTNVFAVRVGEGRNSIATMTLDGIGTHLDLTSNGANHDGLTIGHAQDSFATVNLTGGAKISQSVSASGAARIIVGRGENATGILNVDGIGTLLDYSAPGTATEMVVASGNNSKGTLNITGGAEVSNRNDGVAGANSMYIGNASGAVGTVNISGSGSLFYYNGDQDNTNSTRVYLGNSAGSTGNMTISDGGTMEVYGKALVVGRQGTGNLTIDNGRWVNSFFHNPDFVIARESGSLGVVEVKNGGVIEASYAGQGLTLYLGGDYDSRENSGIANATLKVHGETSTINAGTGNSSLLVGYSTNSIGTFELYDKASVSFTNIGIAVGRGTEGTFKMWGGAKAGVNNFRFAVSMTGSTQGVSNGYAEIMGKDTFLYVIENMQMGNNDSVNTGSLHLAIGDGARVSVGGTLTMNYGSKVSFKIGANDIGETDVFLNANNLNNGDLANTSFEVVGSDSAATMLGDFKLYLMEYNNSTMSHAEIEALFAVNGFNSEYWDVHGFGWDGNALYLELEVLKVIPEPGTYAAIFGALALAFAAYRRKFKNGGLN